MCASEGGVGQEVSHANRQCDAGRKHVTEKCAGCYGRICSQGRLPRGGSLELRPEEGGGIGQWVVAKAEGRIQHGLGKD